MNVEPIKVLLVEDNPGDARLVELALAETGTGFAVQRAEQLSEALDQIATSQFDVALLDLSLPDSDRMETLPKFRQQRPELPIVVLTGLSDVQTALRSLHVGAQDYLVKGLVTGDTLTRALHYAIERQRIQTENKRLMGELQTAKELLERKNRRLAVLYRTAQRFVDNASHEFRTPLTVIREFTSILRDGLAGDVNDEQREYLEIVDSRVDDLTLMVNDMLDVSKLEAGLLGVRRGNFGVEAIVERVRGTLERRAGANKVMLETTIEPGLPEVYCDADKIGRVITNLTVNAIKFSPEGGTIRIWARPGAEDSEVVIGVTDDGPGIDADNLKEIFRRFYQAETHVRASTKGFGLGLNIAKELVHLNLGEINVESELGKGSTFWFSVPMAEPSSLIVRYLKYLKRLRRKNSSVSLMTARLAGAVDSGVADDADELLQHLLRRNDLSFRIEPQTWSLVVCGGPHEVAQVKNRIEAAWNDANRNRPAGTLPAIALETKGTWRTKDQGCQFIERFRAEFPAVESAYA